MEVRDKVFVFDYFRGNRIPEFSFSGVLPEFSKEQNIYVFSSHQHRDHFDMEVFEWRKKYSNIQYIFPKEMRFSDNYLTRNGIDLKVKEQIHYMKPNSELSLDGIAVETFASTDAGVAFLVTYEGRSIYHAGDLHWWHWEGEEEVFNQYQEKTYKRQIDKLAKRKLDVAFVVLDYRLEQAVFWGMDYFMNHVDAANVIPMHLWQKYDLIARYKSLPQTEAFRERILDVTEENQIFQLK